LFTKCQFDKDLTIKVKGSWRTSFLFVLPLQCQLTDNGPIRGLSILLKTKEQSYEKD
jgi:hypothetical protein